MWHETVSNVLADNYLQLTDLKKQSTKKIF